MWWMEECSIERKAINDRDSEPEQGQVHVEWRAVQVLKHEHIVAHKLVLDFQLCAAERFILSGSQFLFSAKSFALHKVAAINVQLY